jgi:hypothetical protein
VDQHWSPWFGDVTLTHNDAVGGGRRRKRAGVGERLEGAADSGAVGRSRVTVMAVVVSSRCSDVQVAQDGARYSLGSTSRRWGARQPCFGVEGEWLSQHHLQAAALQVGRAPR